MATRRAVPALPAAERGPAPPGGEGVGAALAALDEVLAEAVAAHRRRLPAEAPGGQGLFITEADVDRALEAPAAPSSPGLAARLGAVAAGRLGALGEAAGLDAVERALLLVAAAPALDPRRSTLLAYLADEAGGRWATTATALGLAGVGQADPAGRARLLPGRPLVDLGLVEVHGDGPFPLRSLRVDDRVVQHLAGGDDPLPPVAAALVRVTATHPSAAEPVARALAAGLALAYLRCEVGSGAAVAVAALEAVGRQAVVVDGGRLGGPGAPAPEVQHLVRLALREAVLGGGGLVLLDGPAVVARGAGALRPLAEAPCPVIVTGAAPWDTQWCDVVPFMVAPVALDRPERAALWAAALARVGADPALAEGAAALRLPPEQVLDAVLAARAHALAHDVPLDAEAVGAGARAQASGRLEASARRLRPTATFDQLVLPAAATAQLQALVERVRHRDLVLRRWAAKGVGAGREGTAALFAGPPGTGKTLAAEVVAGALGLDVYAIDLSTVVDKYVGETEKHLERVFTEAQGLDAVLLFDEADALFGKRTAVTDGHDRYANVEVAYLLQRVERFDGVCILATNLATNLDEAFARRIDVRVTFPAPDADARRALWALHLRPPLPVADDVDLDALAAVELAGGDIRNVVVAAAFAAATRGGPDGAVAMADLVQASSVELAKLGRLRD